MLVPKKGWGQCRLDKIVSDGEISKERSGFVVVFALPNFNGSRIPPLAPPLRQDHVLVEFFERGILDQQSAIVKLDDLQMAGRYHIQIVEDARASIRKRR